MKRTIFSCDALPFFGLHLVSGFLLVKHVLQLLFRSTEGRRTCQLVVGINALFYVLAIVYNDWLVFFIEEAARYESRIHKSEKSLY